MNTSTFVYDPGTDMRHLINVRCVDGRVLTYCGLSIDAPLSETDDDQTEHCAPCMHEADES